MHGIDEFLNWMQLLVWCEVMEVVELCSEVWQRFPI
jgi:hypothetical protein